MRKDLKKVSEKIKEAENILKKTCDNDNIPEVVRNKTSKALVDAKALCELVKEIQEMRIMVV